MQPYQKHIFEQIADGSGAKRGDVVFMTAGTGQGKTMLKVQQALDRLMRDINSQPISDLVLAERRHQGARFYTVEPIGGNWLEMETWASNTYGPASDVWDFKMDGVGRWYANDRKFWFRNERDRTLFIMRWSGT